MARQAKNATKRAPGKARVHRARLVERIRAGLGESGVVLLAGTRGLGKTTLLADVAEDFLETFPDRPVVRLDYSSVEAQAFREGRRQLLLEWLDTVEPPQPSPLADEVPAADPAVPDDEADGDDCEEGEGPAPHRRRRIYPSRCAGASARLVWTCLSVLAPVWAESFSKGLARSIRLDWCAPLVLVDNFVRSDEGELENFSIAVGDWARAGARFVIASGPMDCPAGQFPESLRIGVEQLLVGEQDAREWVQALGLPGGFDPLRHARGIPLLVAASASVSDTDSLPRDPHFRRAAEVVLASNLAEPLCCEADRARAAVVMLGKGSLGTLSDVGVHLKPDDLVMLSSEFPLLGLDLAGGTFSCLPCDVEGSGREMLHAVREFPQLTLRCLDHLAREGRSVRAGAVVGLLGEAECALALGRNPGTYADAACDGVMGRCLRVPGASLGLDASSASGLVLLGELYDRMHGGRLRRKPFEPAANVPPSHESGRDALLALEAVERAWRCVGQSAAEPAGRLVAQGPASGGDGRKAASAARACETMAVKAMNGEIGDFHEAWRDLCKVVEADRVGLACAVYAHFATMCAVACGQAEAALSWVGALAASSRLQRTRPSVPASVSDALLSADEAFAGFLCERPSATGACDDCIDAVEASRAFFEARGMTPLMSSTGLVLASMLVLSGREAQAEPLFEEALSRRSTSGEAVGQAAASVGLAVCELVRGAVTQALVHLHTASSIARRMRMGPMLSLAHMLESVAELRCAGVPAVDGRMLENSLKRSAIAPRTSAFLEAETAALLVGHNDVGAAADIVQAPGMFSTAYRCRVVCLCLRCMGDYAQGLATILPRSLSLEYASVCREGMAAPLADGAPTALGVLYGNRRRRPLRIEVFGGLRVYKNGHAIPDRQWGRRVARELVTLLALYPERPFTRNEILDVLWDDHPGSANRNNLSTTLSVLRRVIGQTSGGPAYLVTSGDTVMLNLDLVEVDVADFERTARLVLTRGITQPVSELMECCRVVESLYGQGVGPCTGSIARIAARRAEDFEEAFVDCMVVGSRRALDAGSAPTALYFARAARKIGAGRQDVESAMVEAMKAVRDTALVDLQGQAGFPDPALVPAIPRGSFVPV